VKRDKMEKVAAVAKLVEHKSAREFSVSQQSHEDKRAQLDQLLQFKADYDAMLQEKSRDGLSASQFQDYRLFLAKLNQAIEQQAQEVQLAEEELARVRTEWIERSQRTSALDHLVDERHKARIKAGEKAEQKASDERAMLDRDQ